MRWITVAAALTVMARLGAADRPLVEKYLHSGELARGEQALEAALEAAPKDDQVRFGLGVLPFRAQAPALAPSTARRSPPRRPRSSAS